MSTEVKLTVTEDEAAYLESLLRARRDTLEDLPEDWTTAVELAEIELIAGLHPKLDDAETRATTLGLIEEARPVEMLFVEAVDGLLKSVLVSFMHGEDEEIAALAEASKVTPCDAEGFAKLQTTAEFVEVLHDYADSALDGLAEDTDLSARERRTLIESHKSLRASCRIALEALER